MGYRFGGGSDDGEEKDKMEDSAKSKGRKGEREKGGGDEQEGMGRRKRMGVR